MINEEFAPLLVGEDPRDITGFGDAFTMAAVLIVRAQGRACLPNIREARHHQFPALSGDLIARCGTSRQIRLGGRCGAARRPTVADDARLRLRGLGGPDKIGEQLWDMSRLRVPRGQEMPASASSTATRATRPRRVAAPVRRSAAIAG